MNKIKTEKINKINKNNKCTVRSKYNAITQLSGINIPEEHNKYKELLIRFKFLVLEKLIVREIFS